MQESGRYNYILTPGMYPTNLRGSTAQKKYDLFMLGFTLLIASDIENGFKGLVDAMTNKPTRILIGQKLESMPTEATQLKVYILELMNLDAHFPVSLLQY